MADQRIAATDKMTGYGHATKPDTLNKLGTVEHNNDGTHKDAYAELYEWNASGGTDLVLTDAGTFYKWASSVEGISDGALLVPSAANDNIVVGAGGDGKYFAEFCLGVEIQEHLALQAGIFVEGVQQGHLSARAKSATPGVHYPSSIIINAGTLNGGTIADLTTRNGDYVDIQEVAATPGFDVELLFTTSEEHHKVAIWGRYEGGNTHEVEVQAYNYITTSWVDLRAATKDIPNTTEDNFWEFEIPGTKSDYISGGTQKIRIYHTSAGNATHQLLLDKVHLQDERGFVEAVASGLVTLAEAEAVDIKIASPNLAGETIRIASASLVLRRIAI